MRAIQKTPQLYGLVLDENRNYVTNKNTRIYDVEIEYKNKENPSEHSDPYPKIRTSHLVDSHLGSREGQTSLIKVSKFEDNPDSSLGNDREDSDATIITLGTA